MESSKKIPKGQLDIDHKLNKDISTLTAVSLPLLDTDKIIVNRGGIDYSVDKSELGGNIEPSLTSFQKRDQVWYATGNGYSTQSFLGFRANLALKGTGAFNRYFPTNDTNYFTRTRFNGCGTSTTAGNYCGYVGDASYQFFHGRFDWYYRGIYGDCSDTIVADKSIVWGVSNYWYSTTVDPSTLSYDTLALVKDSTDTNFQFMYCKVGDTPTKIDLGINFPANTTNTDVYMLEMEYSIDLDELSVRVKRLNTGDEFTTTLDGSVLPNIGKTLNCGIHNMTNGTSNVECKFGINQIIFSNNKNL